MAEYQSYSYDVLVIGAGGAGLRAAIEAAASGVKVGVVCKSLLGKAHTVMAEGGVAAALANVDDRDNWRVHFADTMRGGQYLNNWRMAELHAKEAPDRVRELEAWGALFDRTKDGRILQRNFGGHRYPRLAHVGDRTGLEMIRTLQDHGIHTGMEVHMECTVLSLLMDSGRIAGAFGYDREKGHFILWPAKAVVLATGGIGRAFKITSNSWEYTGDGHALAYRAGAELLDMEFVQFHPTGMVWPISVRGILVTEGVRGEGGVLRNSEGRRFMFDDIPELYKEQTADTEEEGWRYTQGDKNARRPPELLTRDHVARCINREVKAGRGTPSRRRLSRHRLDQGAHAERSRAHQAQAAQHVSPVQAARRDLDITKEPMEVGPTTHYMMGGIRVDGDSQMSIGARIVRRRRSRGRAARREPARRQFAVRPAGVRQARRPVRRRVRQGATAPRRLTSRRFRLRRRRRSKPFDRGPSGENPYQIQYELQESMQDLVGIVRVESEMQQALNVITTASSASGQRAGISGPSAVQQRLAHGDGSAESAGCLRSDHARGAAAQREPWRAVSRGLSEQRRGVGQVQHRGPARRGRRDAGGEATAYSRCPHELKAVIEEMK